MTSKNSFTKLLLQSIRGRIWGIVLAVAGYILALPIYAGINSASLAYSAKDDEARAALLSRLFRLYVLGEGNLLVILGTIAIAVFLALNCFSYLFSKQKVDLYHGICVKREKLFAANYISGVIAFIVPYTLCLLMTFGVGYANGMIDNCSYTVALSMYLTNIAGFFVVYSSSIIAIMLTGNYPVSILMIIVINAYFPILNLVISEFNNEFFVTYYSMYGNDSDWGEYLSPIGLYTDAIGKVNGFSSSPVISAGGILLVLFVSAVFCTIALLIYKYRKSEAATKALAIKKMERIFAILVLIPGSMCGGSLLLAIINIDSKSRLGWMIFGMAVTLILGHCVIQAIYYSDLHALYRNLLNPAVAAVVIAIVTIVFAFDMIGYDNYIPKEGEFESAALVSYSLQQGIEYYDFENAEVNEWGYVDVYEDSSKHRFDNMKITDYAIIKDFAQKSIDETKVFDKMEEYPEDMVYTSAIIKYNLKNGRSVYREYTVDMDTLKEEYARIYETNEYKDAVYTFLTAENEQQGELHYFNGITDIKLTELNTETKAEILNSCREETYAQKAEETYNELPVGYIYENVKQKQYGISNEYACNKAFIYPSFVKTIALLEKNGININQFYEENNISYIELNRYVNDVYQHVEYNDAESINAILKVAKPYDLFNEDPLFHSTDDGDGNIYLVNGDNKIVYISFLKGDMPAFADKDLNESGANSEEFIVEDNEFLR